MRNSLSLSLSLSGFSPPNLPVFVSLYFFTHSQFFSITRMAFSPLAPLRGAGPRKIWLKKNS